MANSKQSKSIDFFDGINALMSESLTKSSELLHCENARSKIIGTLEKREGTTILGNQITSTINYGIIYFENSGTTGFYRVAKVSGTTSVYYLNGSAVWTALSGSGTNITTTNDYRFNFAIAEDKLFGVNGDNANIEISGTDGTTVTTSAATGSHLYGSPKARKINYYKDKLYLGDYTITGGARYKNGIMSSSVPLGIVALVDGDHASIAIDSEIKVTDLKYIRSADTLDVYRAGTKIADITIDAKNLDTNTITIDTVTMAFGTDFKSSDEIWVDGTYTGTRLFRWPDNPAGGVDVVQYDTFKLAGSQNDRITMMTNIGDVMVIATAESFAIWNGSNLLNYEMDIGCVSDEAFVKIRGRLYFLSYDGIYEFTGEGVPRLISAKVDPYITGATRAGMEAASMGKKGFSVFCAITGNVTLYNPDGSTKKILSDVCLEYNTRTLNSYCHTNIKATQFETYRETTNVNKLIYESTETGLHCLEFLTGESDSTISSTQEIPFRIDFPSRVLSKEFENIVSPQEIIVEVERGSSTKCFVSLDGDDWYQIKGFLRKGVNILKVTSKSGDVAEPPRCREMAISFRDSSVQRCKLSKVKVTFMETGEREPPYRE